MAAGVLNKPGTEYGPCPMMVNDRDPQLGLVPCEHSDCRATRRMAAAPCVHCGDPIGFDTRFYDVNQDEPIERRYAHATCEEARI